MKKVLKSISICFIIAAMLTAGAFAAVPVGPDQPQASEYIAKTTTGIIALGGGKIEVDYSITATDAMKDVGALQVDIYKVGVGAPVWSHYYTESGYGDLMGHNTSSYTKSITYKGTSGCKYYANVTFYAGEDGVAGDLYIMDTVVITA